MKKLLKLCAVVALAALCVCCGNNSKSKSAQEQTKPSKRLENSIYHWKTTFELDSTEIAFLQRHNISRIYTKMFDIAVEHSFVSSMLEPVPIATTKFVSAVPQGVEITPVVYITIEALRAMEGKEAEYAELIVARVMAMCNHNALGKIRELQLDCDWTQQTKRSYDKLCKAVGKLLSDSGLSLSVTLRLHQLCQDAPVADRVVLMLYNTGNLKSIKTKNSILDIADVRPYLRSRNYPLPMDYAYPTFGWGVKFKNGEFQAIVTDTKQCAAGETIRSERPTVAEILKVKALVEQQLDRPSRGNIIYHLDNSQLKNYTDDEISQIFAY
ncbi:MAG: hypothetical protein E7143_07790 [Rikenellaceae bacterium]|nr:hypothetical protein [Rikenellaceae bacterium]